MRVPTLATCFRSNYPLQTVTAMCSDKCKQCVSCQSKQTYFIEFNGVNDNPVPFRVEALSENEADWIVSMLYPTLYKSKGIKRIFTQEQENEDYARRIEEASIKSAKE